MARLSGHLTQVRASNREHHEHGEQQGGRGSAHAAVAVKARHRSRSARVALAERRKVGELCHRSSRLGVFDSLGEGIDAYCMDVGRSACPHKPGSQRHNDWLRGWDEAEAIDFEQRYDR